MVDNAKHEGITKGGKLKQQVFRQLLSEQERTYLVSHGDVYAIEADTVLCQQGQVEDVLYVILLGEVDVIEDVQGHPVLVGKLSTGDLVGEIGALLSVPRIATVVATVSTVVLKIKLDTFRKLMNKTPNLQSVIYQNLYERSLHTALQSSAQQNDDEASAVNIEGIMQCWSTTNALEINKSRQH